MKTDIIYDIPDWAALYIMYGEDENLSVKDKEECNTFLAALKQEGVVRLIEPADCSEQVFNRGGLIMSTDDSLYFVEVIPDHPCEKMIDVFDNEEDAHDFIAYVRKLDPQHRIKFWRGTSRSIPSSYTDIPMDFEYNYHF